ncbi:hypothetical protein BsWGS_10948 [Bradybaena similaris]
METVTPRNHDHKVTQNIPKEPEVELVQLKRTLGLAGASSMVIGSTVGSGIFVSPKGVLQATGSVGLCLIVWVFTGFIQLGAALCFAELGTIIPKSGGTYTYLRLGLGNKLAFVYALTSILLVCPGALVVMMLTFSKYLVTLLPVCGSPAALEKLIAAAGILTLVVVNAYSSKLSAHVSIVTTVAKLSALAVIIISGVIVMCQGTLHELGSGFQGTSQDPSSLALALYSAFWAYSGSENLNNMTEEIKRPSKNIPRAAICGVLVVVAVYTLTNVSYLAVMTRAELLQANAVAVVFGDRVLGPAAKMVPLAVIVSTLGTASSSIFSSSRIIFAAARDKNIPDMFSYIQIRQFTPLGSMLLTVTLAMILLVPADLDNLINYLGFIGIFFNGCVYVCLLIFRWKTMKHVTRVVKVPVVVPVLMVLLHVYMVIAPLVISPRAEYAYVCAGVVVVSLLLYIPFIHFELGCRLYDRLTVWSQLVLQVVPPARFDD